MWMTTGNFSGMAKGIDDFHKHVLKSLSTDPCTIYRQFCLFVVCFDFVVLFSKKCLFVCP